MVTLDGAAAGGPFVSWLQYSGRSAAGIRGADFSVYAGFKLAPALL
jgi:hypothetical protein